MAVREISWEEVLQAGAVIFGPDFHAAARTGGWHGELKAAYRRRALETHPDRAQHLGRSESELAAEFRAVATAYDLLTSMRGGAATPPARTRGDAPAAAPASPAPATGRAGRSARPEQPRPSAGPRAARSAPRAEGPGERWAGARSSRAANGRAANDPSGQPSGRADDGPRHGRSARGRGEPFASRPAAAWTDRGTTDRATTDRGTTSAATAARLRWRSGLPPRRLRLAEFLYYSGRLAWSDFVAAISWQRRQRPEIGRIAVDFGFLERHEVLEILTRRRIEQALAVPFGEFAVRHGYLTAFQVLAVLGQQVRLQRPLGQYFVERGLVSEPELDELRQRVLRHNARWAA